MQDFDQIDIDENTGDLVQNQEALMSEEQSPTLICDYSENELNQLFFNQYGSLGTGHYGGESQSITNSSPGKRSMGAASSPADRYHQLTKLDDEEENVDFIELFTQYQMERQQQNAEGTEVQYYQNQVDVQSERVNQSYGANLEQNQVMQGSPGGVRFNQEDLNQGQPQGKRGNMRPSSATVAGQTGRFLSNQQSKRKSGQVYNQNQLDHVSYSYQQPASMMNNLMSGHTSGKTLGQLPPTAPTNINTNQISQGQYSHMGQFGTHRNSNAMVQQKQAILQRPPIGAGGLSRKKTRPQSAARNQMRPSKELESVTNFTYQKAKQNQNLKTYVPDSLKNTDKERLYEEKITLKKALNQMQMENQQLRTQLQNQQGQIRKKDEMVQQVMKNVFHPPGSQNPAENFLQEFQRREIDHNTQSVPQNFQKPKMKIASAGSVSKIAKSSSALANKDGQLTSLKVKMKELNDQLLLKDKEVRDLKQTLKFTKIKEYEQELALNVQESQRLRILLEREMMKPKVDPRIVQGLRQQNMQYQQIVQNLQHNSQIQAQNYDRLNKKLINQIRKFAKLKEARKRLSEKSSRLEKKVTILTKQKKELSQLAEQQTKQQRNQRRSNSTSQMNSKAMQQAEHQWKLRMMEQNSIIEKLIMKMQQYGVDISEEELFQMQHQSQIEVQNMNKAQDAQDDGEYFAQEQSIHDAEQDQEFADMKSVMDFVVTFGNIDFQAQTEEATKKFSARFENFDELKETLRKEFEINEEEDFQIKFLNDDGGMLELSGVNWDQLKALGKTEEIALSIELLNQQEDPSNYEDEDFDEQVEPEKVFVDPVTLDKVKKDFADLKLIMQIKGVKKGDILKYILHGLKNPDTEKKVNKVSIDTLSKQLVKRIGLSEEIAENLAKYLIEEPNEDGKILQKDFEGQTHNEVVMARRKDVQEKLLAQIPQYIIFNGIAITTLLSRLQGLFEDCVDGVTELKGEFEDADYDEEGILSFDEIIKGLKIQLAGQTTVVALNDEELREFIQFLAMRHSESLDKVDYKEFVKVFEDDFNLIDGKRSRWISSTEDGEEEPIYEASSDEGELDSERTPQVVEDEIQDNEQNTDPSPDRNSGQTGDLDQNELLEKVDEILAQIVKKLPPTGKLRTLTQYMMPFLTPTFDQKQQRQCLVISKNAFIQFLMGQNQNQLGIEPDELHIICLLHALVQEDEEMDQENQDQSQSNKYILFDEFIELVKTYMKKELIMQQSKSLGLNYDILGQESVEFLFQIRSSLMHYSNVNINENSADEEEVYNNLQGQQSPKKQKTVPQYLRLIFRQIIQKKNIALSKSNRNMSSVVEVMDFDQMLEVLFADIFKPQMGYAVRCPGGKAQEELKYLMCLDFKYLELVMLPKFDKIMHDLDYISIDLLRQSQDGASDKQRKKNLERLKAQREEQMKSLKNHQAKKQQKGSVPSNNLDQQSSINRQIYGTSSQQIEYQGVCQSTKQDKKRKRPDDKRQNLSKKMGSRQTYSNAQSGPSQQQIMRGERKSAAEVTPTMSEGKSLGLMDKKSKSNYDQDFTGGHKGAQNMINMTSSSGARTKNGVSNDGNQFFKDGVDVEPNQSHHWTNGDVQDRAIDEDISDQIDDVHEAMPEDETPEIYDDVDDEDAAAKVGKKSTKNTNRNKPKGGQMSTGRSIKSSTQNFKEEIVDDFKDDGSSQDEVPIDLDDIKSEDNYEDVVDEEDGIISDDYEGVGGIKSPQQKGAQPGQFYSIKPEQDPSMGSPSHTSSPAAKKAQENHRQTPLDEHVISMDHSDDIMDSTPNGGMPFAPPNVNSDSIPDVDEEEDDMRHQSSLPRNIKSNQSDQQQQLVGEIIDDDYVDDSQNDAGAMIIMELVDNQWESYDVNGNGALDKPETKRFLHDNLALLGFDTDISQDEFELVFKHFDKNNNGMIEKAEMVNFIKLIIGAQDDDEEEGDDDQMEDLEDNIDEDHQDPMDSDEQYEDQMEDFPQNQQEDLETHNTFTKQESKKQIGYGAVQPSQNQNSSLNPPESKRSNFETEMRTTDVKHESPISQEAKQIVAVADSEESYQDDLNSDIQDNANFDVQDTKPGIIPSALKSLKSSQRSQKSLIESRVSKKSLTASIKSRSIKSSKRSLQQSVQEVQFDENEESNKIMSGLAGLAGESVQVADQSQYIQSSAKQSSRKEYEEDIEDDIIDSSPLVQNAITPKDNQESNKQLLTKKSSRLHKNGNLILDESPISKKKSIDQRAGQVIDDEYEDNFDDLGVSAPEITDSYNASSSLPKAGLSLEQSPQKIPQQTQPVPNQQTQIGVKKSLQKSSQDEYSDDDYEF